MPVTHKHRHRLGVGLEYDFCLAACQGIHCQEFKNSASSVDSDAGEAGPVSECAKECWVG